MLLFISRYTDVVGVAAFITSLFANFVEVSVFGELFVVKVAFASAVVTTGV